MYGSCPTRSYGERNAKKHSSATFFGSLNLNPSSGDLHNGLPAGVQFVVASAFLSICFSNPQRMWR